ncbi:metallo-beta-lactamase family protein [Metarhizium album ARSEF 1941]|uniref:Metallo-beta-lactamase family protein n=1 Tax=Metarhizium album (strain ARSEF 1941) TaxID=1081103 RepID=A0A0B2X4Q4_METAS|nr:metallo-beta-lactamase family protein [Metarhizium album ARSEF 1941]KHO00435.1 metallo-beta-lactamase family protein [Metarhizium album ARSEF 1941]
MAFTAEKYDPAVTGSWLVCNTCGTQFATSDVSAVKTCHICDDPRSFVPASGQSFTTHDQVAKKHRNQFTAYAGDERFVSIATTPKFAIGQRAILMRTGRGNILWDCLTLLDQETINHIHQLGGLKAIVISHPHYYSTHVQWGRAFRCPVYIASEDKPWTTMDSGHQVLVTNVETSVSDTDAVAIKLGGHFPGSLALLFDGRLLIADTLVTTPAGIGKWEVDGTGAARAKPPGLNSFSFLWSIPNYVPLDADELARMWAILKRYQFKSTHGAFLGMDIEDPCVKQRVLESMQIQAKAMGYAEHGIMRETI